MLIKKKPRRGKWRDSHWITVYKYAQAGLSNKRIREVMGGIDKNTWNKWMENHPDLLEEINKLPRSSQADSPPETPFRDYVYGRLSPKLQKIWDQICELDDAETGPAMIDSILDHHGQRVRQNLFIHALISTNFNKTRACAKVGISVQKLYRWVEEDPDFGEIVAQIKEYKKDFYEEALVKVVAKGDPMAIVFVNKTYNKDRGYSEKVDVSVTSKQEGILDMEDLDLPLEVRKELLKAIRAKQNPVIAAIESKPKEPETIMVDAKVTKTTPIKE